MTGTSDRASVVSVVMSVLNGERDLREAIDSVLGQTLQNLELVLIDNGSTDGTAAIISSYTDPRITVLRNEKTVSLPASLNRGIRAAKAPLIGRLDADDIAKPERFELQVAYMDRHPTVAMIGTWWEFFWTDKDGRRVVEQGPETPVDHAPLVDRIAAVNPLGHSTLMFRRDVIMSLGCYDESMPYAQDWALVMAVSQHHRLGCIPHHVTMVRQHENQLSAAPVWAKTRLEDAAAMHRLGLLHPAISLQGRTAGRRALAGVYLRLAQIHQREGALVKAARLIAQSLALAPFHAAGEGLRQLRRFSSTGPATS
jgi:glycosyltransferase involved in cell wall biosynthesis